MEINLNFSGITRHDDEFLIAARAGVEGAFTQLMMQYKFAIYFLLLKMVNNRKEAEDLTFEVLGKALTNIHQYNPQLAFSTWLFQIVLNIAIEHLHNKSVAVSLEFIAENDMP